MGNPKLGFVGTFSFRSLHGGKYRSFSRTRQTRCCAADAAGTGRTPLKSPGMVRARHILVETEEMIDSVAEQINEGKGTFDSLASIVSTCPSKVRGGDLGWFKRNMMVKPFEEAAFDNPPGSVIKVQTEFGWHLVKVEEHSSDIMPISVQEFAVRLSDGSLEDVQMIDCREPNEVEIASLPGFLNLPMSEYGRWAEDFEKGVLTLDKNKETIVMCHHGVRSAMFCSFLGQQGFQNVRNLTGGIDAYSKEVDPSVPQY